MELSQDQLKKLFQDAKTGLQEVGDDDEGIDNGEEEEVDANEDGEDDAETGAGEDSAADAEEKQKDKEEEDELAKYGLDNYDDDDEPMEGTMDYSSSNPLLTIR